MRPTEDGCAELVARCRDGDERAWEELVHRFGSLIYSVPSGLFGLRPEDSAEIFQETCCVLLTRLDTLEKPEALPGWLFQTARYQTLAFLRRKGKHRRGMAEFAREEPVAYTTPPTLEEEESGIPGQRVRMAFEQLGETCRFILEERYYKSPPTSYKDIAQQTGLPIGSIGPQRARCLKSLLEILRRVQDD